MIFAETDRLYLRSLEESELPRLVQLLDVWDVVRWLSVVPFPYRMNHAEEFYADLKPSYESEAPQFYAMALKSDNLLIGGVGLHPPRNQHYLDGEVEIGYWLGQEFWGRKLMQEGAAAALKMGFKRAETRMIGATTSPGNRASQNVLSRIGLRNMGEAERDYAALRGDHIVLKWLITREEYEQGSHA